MKTHFKIHEDFLQSVWKFLWFDLQNLQTIDNKKIQILNVGKHNFDAGPDFLDATIVIDGITWIGNIEIHVKSSEWYTHKHQIDYSYNNVILHVVLFHDLKTFNANQLETPILELGNRLNPSLFEKLKYLNSFSNENPCKPFLKSLNQINKIQWLERLYIERLEEKSKFIYSLLLQTQMNWEQVLYINLASNFGFKINKIPFEHLAMSLPYKILQKHRLNISNVESMMFGVSGFFNSEIEDSYFQELKNKYIHYKNMYGLNELHESEWKFMRTRPSNFPTIRISQFANLIVNQSNLFSMLMETETLEHTQKVFNISASDYWSHHSKFGYESKNLNVKLGSDSIYNIIINTIIPFIYIYGKIKSNHQYINRAISMAENTVSEKNTIINFWKSHHIEAQNSMDSQALLFLKKQYCDKKRCASCNWGRMFVGVEKNIAC